MFKYTLAATLDEMDREGITVAECPLRSMRCLSLQNGRIVGINTARFDSSAQCGNQNDGQTCNRVAVAAGNAGLRDDLAGVISGGVGLGNIRGVGRSIVRGIGFLSRGVCRSIGRSGLRDNRGGRGHDRGSGRLGRGGSRLCRA